jgi:hypothetical protein
MASSSDLDETPVVVGRVEPAPDARVMSSVKSGNNRYAYNEPVCSAIHASTQAKLGGARIQVELEIRACIGVTSARKADRSR